MTHATSDRQIARHGDQNVEQLALTLVHPIRSAEAILQVAREPAALTDVRAGCYQLQAAKVGERNAELVRAASVERSRAWLALWGDETGAIQLEYTILLGLVGLSSAAALVLLGVALVDSFGFVRGMLLTPFP